MLLYAVQQRNGDIMLTHDKPELVKIKGADLVDWYALHGDPIATKHLCKAGFEALARCPAETFATPKRIRLTLELLDSLELT